MAATLYVTQADLVARFTAEKVAQLFSVQQPDASDSGAVDSTAFTAIAGDAGTEFEEIMGTEFDVPFAAESGGGYDPAIVEIVAIFTMFRAASRRPEYSAADHKSAPYAREYHLALTRCHDIKAGKRRLVGANRKLAANTGGQTKSNQPDGIAPYFYFVHNPNDGTGGASQF